ncbi:MAG: transcriptional regulator, family [Pseudonocardiales bacterium]|nr:transcriptional regulator, family [Pseudonocardiales bacterium]
MSTDRAGDESSHEYAKSLGVRLRAIRAQQHLSLHGVERKSQGRWKAVVVGSYERGDRAISVQRLSELAGFYGVPVGELLPREARHTDSDSSGTPLAKVVLNLSRVKALDDDEALPLARFVTAIQRERGDYGGGTLSIRRDDMRMLALLYDTSEDGVTERLVRWQVLAPDSLILDGEP